MNITIIIIHAGTTTPAIEMNINPKTLSITLPSVAISKLITLVSNGNEEIVLIWEAFSLLQSRKIHTNNTSNAHPEQGYYHAILPH